MIELNRLCVDCDTKNASSKLVGTALRMIPKPKLIVSYADMGQRHIGYIYQATNWLYTGLVKGDTQIIALGRIMHRQTAKDIFGSSAIAAIRAVDPNAKSERLGDKHRYVYFVGNKKERKEMLAALRYPVLPYPKGDTKRYDASAEIETQTIMF